MKIWLENDSDTRAAGAALAPVIQSLAESGVVVVYVRGNLGAGKSTLVRGLLQRLGVKGVMPSPTYTLVEPYDVGALKLFHMDAYRLADGAELDYLGLEDVSEPGSVLLVEWPDHVRDALPAPSIILNLEVYERPANTESAGPQAEASEGGGDRGDEPSSEAAADPGRLLTMSFEALTEPEARLAADRKEWSGLTRVVT